MTGINELRREVVEQVRDAMNPESEMYEERWTERLSPSVQTAVERASRGEELTLTELALVCRDALAWDSPSFLDLLGVEHTPFDHASPTFRGWRQLDKINGAPFTFVFSDWDT